MRLLKALYFNFTWIHETLIKSRYKETPKGKAEQERLYWERREAFTRRRS